MVIYATNGNITYVGTPLEDPICGQNVPVLFTLFMNHIYGIGLKVLQYMKYTNAMVVGSFLQ